MKQDFVKKLDPLVLVLVLHQIFSTFLLCSLSLSLSLNSTGRSFLL
jgi:hypothetical protein